MHMLSRKDLNSAELETVRVSKSPTMVVTANGKVQTKEEATVHVEEVDLFVTDTPAVLSLEKVCEDNGYSYEMSCGQKPQLIKDGWKINYDRDCDICMRTKITRAPCRKRTGTFVPRAENFGNLITADH